MNIVPTLVFLFLAPLEDRSQWRETQWSALMAMEMRGVAEFRTPDGSRVDILTKTHAWEVEWCTKHFQAVGQSLFYAIATNRKPGIILLMRDSTKERKYYLRCLAVCARYDIKLIVRKVP